MWRIIVGTLLLATVIACGGTSQQAESTAGPSAGGFVPDTKPAPPVRWSEATIPPGTHLELALSQALSSETSRPGDRFRARMIDAVVQGGKVVLPATSIVEGQVMNAVPAGRGAGVGGGSLSLAFEKITTPFGADAAVDARVVKTGVPMHLIRAGAISGGSPGRSAMLPPEARLTVVLNKPVQIKVRE